MFISVCMYMYIPIDIYYLHNNSSGRREGEERLNLFLAFPQTSVHNLILFMLSFHILYYLNILYLFVFYFYFLLISVPELRKRTNFPAVGSIQSYLISYLTEYTSN